MKPVVSCITPFHNAAPYLPELLAAMARQTLREPCEFLFCDNRSTDDSRGVIAAWSGRLPGPVRIIEASGRKGPAHARNAGMRAADGEYLAFCDADDRPEATWLEFMLAELRTSGADFVSGSNRLWDGSPGPCTTRITNAARGLQLDYLPMMQGGNMLGKAAVIRKLDGWCEELLTGEDVDFSWRAQRRGCRIACSDRAVMDYRTRPDLRGSFRQYFRYGMDDILLLKKYPDRPRRQKKWRGYWEEVRPIPVALWHAVRGKYRRDEGIVAAQIAGKKLGHLAGSLRHGHFHF